MKWLDAVPAADAGASNANGGAGTAPVLAVDGLTIGFGSKRILADLRFQVPERGITVLMGPGGAGKSTLLYWLSGLPTSSRRFHEGHVQYRQQPIASVAERPALVQQKAQLLMGRLVEMLSASLRPRLQATPAQLRQAIIARLHALEVGHFEDKLDTVVADLGAAEIRIATVLQAAFTDPALLLIDEPTHGLPQDTAEPVLALIQRIAESRACLVTTHNQRHARTLASRALLLAGGRILVDAGAADFFANRDDHPVLAQFLRTGSCSVPGLDAQPEHLADNVAAPAPSTDTAAIVPPDPAPTAPPPVARDDTPAARDDGPAAAAPVASAAGITAIDAGEDPPTLLSTESEFPPVLTAPPSSLGPTGFRWLVRGRIAGCAKPGVVASMDHDLALLRRMGITLLINLTEHEFPQDALARHGLKGFAVKIEDRRAPPLLWAKLLLAKMERFLRDGEVIAVHCLAGLGRTGTVLCAWLIKEGLTAAEALRRLRMIDPGFVQSDEQEQLLAELESNLLIRIK